MSIVVLLRPLWQRHKRVTNATVVGGFYLQPEEKTNIYYYFYFFALVPRQKRGVEIRHSTDNASITTENVERELTLPFTPLRIVYIQRKANKKIIKNHKNLKFYN